MNDLPSLVRPRVRRPEPEPPEDDLVLLAIATVFALVVVILSKGLLL